MLRDYLKIDDSDRLVEQGMQRLNNRGQEDITEWRIIGANGEHKGRVSLFDKMCIQRSWCVSYRITQTDVNGRVVVDHLTDVL
ncbi:MULTISPECIES: hypothetical protein [Pantoea]|uniref:Uncharacterized protein n=1 Tax=Pantoea cypripedii TaxID=55209 RepID=A0A1X1EW14_PANCY|nr:MULTISPECIES: hypothetical protein [Pantoea]MBP2198121.1 hypothetical protein [Pantoea cypripedii]MDE1186116.1 hypothetical protein [Pantoea sp.]ORM93965.1 hypothetical protein HA50_11620 [Pantoea cypripedii]